MSAGFYSCALDMLTSTPDSGNYIFEGLSMCIPKLMIKQSVQILSKKVSGCVKTCNELTRKDWIDCSKAPATLSP